MKNSKVLKTILIILGLFLIVFGPFRLINPVSSLDGLGVVLDGTLGPLSEARGSGGVLLGFGLLFLIGAFKKKLTYTSTLSAVVLFFGFGIGRLISVAFDGNPGNAMLGGMASEFAFGLLALFALLKYRD